MAQALSVRAGSFAASAALLGLAAAGALSVSVTLQTFEFPPPPAPVPVVTVRPDPPPPPITRDEARSQTPTEDAVVSDAAESTTSTPQLPYDFVGVIGPPGPALITDPHWVRQPRDLARYYPRRALGRNVEGMVVLDCLVATNGLLECGVVSETPANWGFADAALRIASDYRMTPATRDGAPVQGRYRMRVPFNLE